MASHGSFGPIRYSAQPCSDWSQQTFPQQIDFFLRLGSAFTIYPYKLRQKILGSHLHPLHPLASPMYASDGVQFIVLLSAPVVGLDPAAATPTQNVLHIMPTNSPSFIHGLNMSTTTADPTRGKVVLSNGMQKQSVFSCSHFL